MRGPGTARGAHGSSEASPALAPRAGRDPSFDLYKGLAILEVVAHHLTGYAYGRTVEGALSHEAYGVLNRSLHFGVIGFLMLNALLLARSQSLRPRPWKEFYRKQMARLLIPYLTWSLLYLAYRGAFQEEGFPRLLEDWKWAEVLLWGKAYYHLYFLAILWQFYLLFPLFLAAARRFRLDLPFVVLAGLGAQLLVIELFRMTPPPRFPYPGTLAVWQVTPLFVGCWLGLRSQELPRLWRRWRWLVIPVCLLALAIQLPLGLRDLKEEPVDSLALHLSLQLYAVSLGLGVLAAGRWLADRPGAVSRALERLGAESLTVYLLHPALLHLYGMLVMSHLGKPWAFHGGLLLGGAAITLVCLGAARLARRSPLKRPLLGE